MTHRKLTIAAISLLCITAATTEPPVTFDLPRERHGKHGKGQWSVKDHPSTPPEDAIAIYVVTPSDILMTLDVKPKQ